MGNSRKYQDAVERSDLLAAREIVAEAARQVGCRQSAVARYFHDEGWAGI